MIVQLLILTVSFIVLLWAAQRLVLGASGLACYYKLSPLLIGFTLVALGTSAPEIMVAIQASLAGMPDLALGNAIGSNIANIGLVLGISTVIRPIRINSSLLRREYPLLFIVMLFTFLLIIDGYLGVIDGVLLLLACLGVMIYLVYHSRRDSHAHSMTSEFQEKKIKTRPLSFYYIALLSGMILLPLGSHYVVSSSASIARMLGVSELVIGLTILAIGTSLPELVTSLVAAAKGADDIAIGNILGSNIFNLLAVIAFPAIIHPAPMNNSILWRDVPIMFVITMILWWMNMTRKKSMSRYQGGFLILIYVSYIVGLTLDAII
ncbi:MAG: calcium/sodium antiporter [Legionellaceae bacterium]|nr:calcium/sodium antiporter [Legionellaceae bacterium]